MPIFTIGTEFVNEPTKVPLNPSNAFQICAGGHVSLAITGRKERKKRKREQNKIKKGGKGRMRKHEEERR